MKPSLKQYMVMLDIKDMFIRQRQKTDKELYQYLYNNKDGLKPYQSRGIELPELGEGLKYGSVEQSRQQGEKQCYRYVYKQL